ncbi:hypothetical protein [Campylobacter concisus]|nr:hypothetical protein [Campylobacter concisus]
MSKLVFTPSKFCFSAGDEVMLKAFKKHLHIYSTRWRAWTASLNLC